MTVSATPKLFWFWKTVWFREDRENSERFVGGYVRRFYIVFSLGFASKIQKVRLSLTPGFSPVMRRGGDW